ncbi:MAG: hypothetical protein NTU53_08055 [Planctomycetota bacterium]|nr:hypothetical protein [Planctomycetota bacterium]
MFACHLLAIGKDQMWPVYALAAATIAYVILRPMFRKKKDPLEKPLNFSLVQQRAVEREMSNLLVELSVMARQLTAQLDTRTAKLELLMQEADQKIAQLKQLTSGSASSSLPSLDPSPVSAEPSPAIDPRHAEVYMLADQGRTPAEIAQQLGRPRGEVELILALRPR